MGRDAARFPNVGSDASGKLVSITQVSLMGPWGLCMLMKLVGWGSAIDADGPGIDGPEICEST